MSSIIDTMGRRELLVAVMVICAFFTFSDYIFVYNPTIHFASVTITSWTSMIALFSVGLGVIITLKYNLTKVLKKEKEWYWPAWFIFVAVSMYAVGMVLNTDSDIYTWLFKNVLGALGSTTGSLVGLFCFTAAYRAFKVRNWDATILLVTALIVMIGRNIPIGNMISPSIPALGNWLLDFPNTGANRGIRFILGITAMGYSIRILLGRERGA